VWPTVALTLGALLTEFCGLLGPTLGGARRYDGPMGKSDRALLVGALGLAGGLFPQALRWWPDILWAAAALTLLTCRNRVSGALREPESPR
jgi:phosphatidylglycerophosphate synthase